MDWGLPESQQTQVEGDRELFVGGVHVHIFLKDPHFPLRNPKVTPPPHPPPKPASLLCHGPCWIHCCYVMLTVTWQHFMMAAHTGLHKQF